jgi:hypothetical protein
MVHRVGDQPEVRPICMAEPNTLLSGSLLAQPGKSVQIRRL